MNLIVGVVLVVFLFWSFLFFFFVFFVFFLCAVVGSAPLSFDTKKIDNTFGKSASFITAHRCSPNTHAHTQIRARTHTNTRAHTHAELPFIFVGVSCWVWLFFVIIPRFRARLGLRRERAQSFPRAIGFDWS